MGKAYLLKKNDFSSLCIEVLGTVTRDELTHQYTTSAVKGRSGITLYDNSLPKGEFTTVTEQVGKRRFFRNRQYKYTQYIYAGKLYNIYTVWPYDKLLYMVYDETNKAVIGVQIAGAGYTLYLEDNRNMEVAVTVLANLFRQSLQKPGGLLSLIPAKDSDSYAWDEINKFYDENFFHKVLALSQRMLEET